ncbi:coiled-coil domain-containing protein 69-like [Amia ocellicauda]|uniref:coiled-coil domain-containing protein 69-like n=1 Tax=Amia ocellicauda TaxID=2972642 RepID=UPI003464020C
MGCCQSQQRSSISRNSQTTDGHREDRRDRSQHEATGLAQLRHQHERELQELRETLLAAGKQEREELLRFQREEIERVRQDVANKVKSETSAQLRAVRVTREVLFMDANNRTIEGLQQSLDEDKSSLTKSCEAARASFQGTVDDHNTEDSQESIFRRDLWINIRTHGSPGAFWEQELQSLHSVICMKSQQIKVLSRKEHQMQSLTEKNLFLKKQLKKIQHCNEELSAQHQDLQTYIQQLTGELTALQQALAKESQHTQKLGLQKEQLHYRLSSPESPVPSHPSPLPSLSPANSRQRSRALH